MNKLAISMVLTGTLLFSSVANALPVPGFEAPYAAATGACTAPGGSADACRAALSALIDAYIGPTPTTPLVAEAVAATSFSELRAEIRAANAANPQFLAAIEAVFEELLPDSGDVGPTPSPTA